MSAADLKQTKHKNYNKNVLIFSRGSSRPLESFCVWAGKQGTRIRSVVFLPLCLLVADRNVLLQATSKHFKSIFGHVQSLWTSSFTGRKPAVHVTLEEWMERLSSERVASPLVFGPAAAFLFHPKTISPVHTVDNNDYLQLICATVAPGVILSVWWMVDTTLSLLHISKHLFFF